MPRRVTLAVWVVAGAVAVLAVVLPRITPRRDFSALTPDQRVVLEDARAAYARFPVLPLTEATAADDLLAVLDAAPERPMPPATAQIPAGLTPEEARRHRARLNRLMAEFLLHAVVRDDPHAYAAWRIARGDRLMTVDELHRHHHITDHWLEFTGKPMPEGATNVDCFNLVARHVPATRPPERRVVGVLNHPDAAYTVLAFTNPHVPTDMPHPDPLGDLWSGAQTGTLVSFFTAATTRQDLFQRARPVLRARTGVILVDAGGVRHPMTLSLFFDDTAGRWIIDHLNFGNLDRDHELRMLY